MKKVIASMLAILLLCSCGFSVFAAETESTEYGMEGTYTIHIPDSFQIDAKTMKGQIPVSLSGADLPDNSALVLVLESENATEDAWYLAGEKGKVEYSVYSEYAGYINPYNYVWLDADFINGKTLTDNITVEILDEMRPGAYYDKLTYVVWIETTGKCTFCGGKYNTAGCDECNICEACVVNLKHCDGCGCINKNEEHKQCVVCQKCVNPPLYCDEHQQCFDCDECFTIKDIEK